MTPPAIFARMTHNIDSESSDLPNGHPSEAPTLRIVSETPETLPVVPPLPDPTLPPRHPDPPKPYPGDLLWLW